MTTLVPDKRHPALDIDERERVDYLTVVASMAFADKSADDRELDRVRDMCANLELSDEGTEQVISTAATMTVADVKATLTRLSASDLRYALLIDAFDIAYADDQIVAAEAAELKLLAERLGINSSQMTMLERYVATRTHHEAVDDEANEQVAKGLAATGIPAAALGVAAVAGAPIAAGIGVAAALGVGSYMSVRWLFARRRERRGVSDTSASASPAKATHSESS